MAAPTQDICAAWCTAADHGSPCDDYGFDSALVERTDLIASNLLYKLSFRRYPGICRETVRPCPHAARCGCGYVSTVRLPSTPVVRIVSVAIDGATLDPTGYRLDNYRNLVRLDAGDGVTTWPCWQDHRLAATEANTFAVTYDYGLEPPEDGVFAAAALSCQLALSFSPETAGQCRLPKRITSMVRQGVSIAVLDPLDLFEQGRTGIPEVDLFLASEKVGRAQRPATARRLGSGRRARRCTSC